MEAMRFFILLLVTSIILLLGTACSVKKEIAKSDSHSEMMNADGIWQQEGYSRIIELKDTTISVYDICEIHCSLSFSEHVLDFGEVVEVNKNTLIIKHGIDRWVYKKMDKLPEVCTIEIADAKANDVQYNFEVFWHTFNENYCAFDVKGIDWQEVYRTQKAKLNANTTELELYLIFEEMIELLNDGHVKMGVPSELVEAYQAHKESINKKPSPYSFLHELELGEQIATIYLDSVRQGNAGMVRWGMINKDIGYVQVNGMIFQANYGIPEDVPFPEFYNNYGSHMETRKDEPQRSDEEAGMKKRMDKIITELADAKSFILDIRFNGGGKDAVAMDILNHFCEEEKLVATKKASQGGQILNKQDIRTQPSRKRFEGDVYLITSHRTASAAELLTLGSLALDNFTRIGSRTEGIFSSTLDKVLPNGWDYEFSNEIYNDLAGNNYENRGIEPDHAIGYARDKDKFIANLYEELKLGKDAAIEKVLLLKRP